MSYTGFFYHRGVQYHLGYVMREDNTIPRFFVHTDLGVYHKEPELAIIDDPTWAGNAEPHGIFANDGINIFENSKLSAGKDKLFMTIAHSTGGYKYVVVLTLEWKHPAIPKGIKCQGKLTGVGWWNKS